MKMKGLKGKMYEELLRSLGFFSPEQRRLRRDFMVVYSFSREKQRRRADLLFLVTKDRS